MMIHKVSTTKPITVIDRDLRASAARHQFGVIAVHDLQDTLRQKGISLGMQCQIYEVCNPHQAKKVLEADGAISTALPCRISVYGDGKTYTLATMLPTAMMEAFGRPEIAEVAREVEEIILEMMDDASKG